MGGGVSGGVAERGAHMRTHPSVVLSAVHKEQRAEEAELADCKVGVVHRRHALLADDAHANVPRLDHRDVVRAVANRQSDSALNVAAHQFDELRLL